MSVDGALTATEYIKHHLANLASTHQESIVDFSVINYDTLFFSILLMGVTLWALHKAANKATSGVPGKFQCAVEMLVGFVNDQARTLIHGDRTFIAPLALTVFVWVAMMNCVDLLPVDLLPWIAGMMGFDHLRPLSTADLNGTLGISGGVLLLMIYYGFKAHGCAGFFKGLVTAPFGANPLLWPFNLALNLIEYLAKCVSLGMRLFGNMYAGELLFFLIALLGGYAMSFGFAGGSASAIGQIVAGLGWWLFHVLIVLLQAFIMMMLTLVYLGQAHDSH